MYRVRIPSSQVKEVWQGGRHVYVYPNDDLVLDEFDDWEHKAVPNTGYSFDRDDFLFDRDDLLSLLRRLRLGSY
jgi:hypothetical protein